MCMAMGGDQCFKMLFRWSNGDGLLIVMIDDCHVTLIFFYKNRSLVFSYIFVT